MKELAAERAAVREAVSSLRLAPVLFELGARPHPPRDLYRAYLRQSDIFIGIYAGEYGWVAPDMTISGIEDEYTLARGMPQLLYVKDVPERHERLRDMLARIADEGAVSYRRFKSGEELRDMVADDLATLLTERFARAPEREASACLLPSYPTSLIGREREIGELTRLLVDPDTRLVTLVGTGGTGKTRLAVGAAWQVWDSFRDGATFVGLADLRDPSLVAPSIASAIGLQAEGEAANALIDELRKRQMLLLLDNFEQVVDAAPVVAEIVQRAPGVTVLVTSREPLGVYGERQFPVSPLSLAGDADGAAESSAVRLFVERARAVRPDFALTPANAPDVNEICARLDRLPLAIELAAATARVLPPRAIRERLGLHLDGLLAPERDRPQRHRTMHSTIEWSYQLLDERERRVFERLGVFAGGLDVEAAERVCGAAYDGDVLDALASLCAKSLLRADSTEDGEPRFGLLHVVRAYALEKLEERGDLVAARDDHADHFAAFADRHEETLARSRDDRDRRPLDLEYANMRDALAWSLERLGAKAEATAWCEKLLGTLYFYWYMSGRSAYVAGVWHHEAVPDSIARPDGAKGVRGQPARSEGREWSERALAAAEAAGDERARAQALFALGTQAMWQGSYAEARSFLDESVVLWRRLGDTQRLGRVLMTRAINALNEGDAVTSKTGLAEAAAIFRGTPYVATLGICLMHLGDITSREGDIAAARRYLLEAFDIERGIGAVWSAAAVLNSLGELERMEGDYEEAGARYREALEILEQLSAASDIARATHSLAYVALRGGDVDGATDGFERSLASFERLGHRRGMAEAIIGIGAVAAARGQHKRAARLIGAGDRLIEEIGAGLWPADARERECDLAVIRDAIGSDALAEEIAAGRDLTLEAALQLARAG